eukprot:5472736-Heterocapsa_arctica.AAC.1
MKNGGERIDTLTTRELMEYRVIWDQGIGYTIPPWARHLNTGTCQFCYCKDYVNLLGCQPMLKEYNKEKDDRARGLLRGTTDFCKELAISGDAQLLPEQDPLGPPVIDVKLTESERARYRELNAELAARLKHVAERAPIPESEGDVTPRPANMDTGAAGASDSTGGPGFPPAGTTPAKAVPPPVPGLQGKAPAKGKGKGKAPPPPLPPPPAAAAQAPSWFGSDFEGRAADRARNITRQANLGRKDPMAKRRAYMLARVDGLINQRIKDKGGDGTRDLLDPRVYEGVTAWDDLSRVLKNDDGVDRLEVGLPSTAQLVDQ